MKKKIHIKWKNLFMLTSLITLLIVIFVIDIRILKWHNDNKNSIDVINDLNDSVIINESNITDINTNEDEKNTTLDQEPKIDYEKIYRDFANLTVMDVDLKELINKNNDITGWLKVNGTNISYPFVLYHNNKYYLTHDVYKEPNGAGWIFLDYRNNKNLDSKNNIIYGHGRENKTMFGTLKDTLNASWFNNKDNHIIKISTENYNYVWQVFSVYKIANTNDYIKTEFKNALEFNNFTDMLIERSIYDFGIKLNDDDIILTLSTCFNDDYKVVVHSKLLMKNKK